MSSIRIPEYSIYVPFGSDKGDCLFCKTGVLVRDEDVQKFYKVDEGYKCDTCGKSFIEGINLIFKFPEYLGIPRRCFVEVNKRNAFRSVLGRVHV